MKNQYEIKVQALKKRSKINPKSIPNSDQNVRSFFLRFWIKIHSILTPKSAQEPPKIDPETPQEPPRHHPSTKSLPNTSQEPPQTSQTPPKSRPRPPKDPPKSDFGSLFHLKTSLRTTIFEPRVSSFQNRFAEDYFRGLAARGLPH